MKHLTILLICLTIGVTSCQTNKKKAATHRTEINTPPVEVPIENGMAKAYFASGCFWCVEAIYESVKGCL